MARSKIIYNNNTLIDLTPSTAIADDVAEGKKFYLANGNSAIGTNQGGGGGEPHEISVEPEISVDKSVSTLPYAPNNWGQVVVYHNEIHLLGGSYSNGTGTNHYKWDGTEWTSVSTLPYVFYWGKAVVYNDEIHILGGHDGESYLQIHYKWDGVSWTQSVANPNRLYSTYGSVVVYNNKIYLFSSNGSNSWLYTWSEGDSSWTYEGTLTYNSASSCFVVYNNEIHQLTYNGNHYKYNGTSWSQVGVLPFTTSYFSVVVYNDEIHLLGGVSSGSYPNYHSKWDGTSWSSLDLLPYNFAYGYAVVYKKSINILGSNYGSSTKQYHYALAIPITSTPTLNITANGIYNLIGSKTEQNLNKLVTDLTGDVSCGINVEIDTSGTATADKIASGYTAWVNGEKLTGTMATGGTMYSKTATASGTNSLTFSSLSIPYANINHYMLFRGTMSSSTSLVSIIVDGSAYTTRYASSAIRIESLSGLSVSGSGSSITFTKSSGFNTSYTYYLYYC